FCFIGAGNLATNLAKELHDKVGRVVQVYSRTENAANELARQLSTSFTTNTEQITSAADIYFVALKDSAVPEVLSKIQLNNQLLVHCSGSLPLSALSAYSENAGVFYPLQTFSKKREVDFRKIPVFIESSSGKNQQILMEIAEQISDKVSALDSEKRKGLHVAAVFACNFVNHLYTLSADFLETKNIPFEVLHPLIEETARKVQEMEPALAQTGPAVRFDKNIIDTHLKMLEKFPEMKELYNSISKSIFERHQKV
ncbi:MAG TPA: DUF2520 domain-containing protein, partial [Draconibacterium sp.]|nr:DUF2520 domain-containing protein [Draconibacterium sp.]